MSNANTNSPMDTKMSSELAMMAAIRRNSVYRYGQCGTCRNAVSSLCEKDTERYVKVVACDRCGSNVDIVYLP